MLLRPCDLVHGVVFKGFEILVALVTVFVIVEVLFVVLHDLLCVKRHVAVCVRAFDPPNGFECGWHLPLFPYR
jgi:hypothetical protein